MQPTFSIVGFFTAGYLFVSLESIVRPIMDIRKGEWSKTLLSAFYFFLTITAYYILKPARNSLFIEYIGVDNIPYATICIALISFPIISIYAQYVKKVENKKFVSSFLLLAIASLLLFRWAFTVQGTIIPPIVSFIFFVWLTLFNGITVMQLWSLANDIFDAQSAKRLYGFVGCGGILGGMTGSWIAKHAKLLGTENLLLVSALYIFFMMIVYNYICFKHRSSPLDKSEKESPSDPQEKVSQRESFDVVRHSRYLVLILLVIVLMKVVTVQSEWQYNKFVAISFDQMNMRTSFFGQINYYLNFASLFIQLVFTSRILKRFGVNLALIPLPLGLFLGTIAILIYPGVRAAAILKISEGGLRYSINQTATNYLYLPIKRIVRYKIRPFIDVIGYQFAKGFGGVLTIFYLLIVKAITDNDVHHAVWMSYLNAGLLLLWFVVIFYLRKEYSNEIRRFLIANKSISSPDDKDSRKKFLETMAEHKTLEDILQIKDEVHTSRNRSVNIRMAVCVALYEGGKDRAGLNKLIAEIVKAEGGGLRMSFPDSQDMVDEVLQSLAERKDSTIRFDAIKLLNQVRAKKEEYGFDTELIKKQIMVEVDDYYKTMMVHVLYGTLADENAGSGEHHDFLNKALENIQFESLERIFRLLALMYSPVDINLVYQGLLDENVYMRANALEFLDQIVERHMMKKIMPLLDGEISVLGEERAGYFTTKLKVNSVYALKRALSSDDRWLTLCAMVIIAKFEFTELYESVFKYQQSKDGLLREAAHFLCERMRSAEGNVFCAKRS
jgi:ATP/ADP translocase